MRLMERVRELAGWPARVPPEPEQRLCQEEQAQEPFDREAVQASINQQNVQVNRETVQAGQPAFLDAAFAEGSPHFAANWRPWPRREQVQGAVGQRAEAEGCTRCKPSGAGEV